MPSKSEANSSSPMAPELSNEARKAVKAVFDAMSTWQTELANSNEKNLERVIGKVAAAAEAMGWPREIADAVRTQMQAITKMHSQMMDQMISAWEEQTESPSSPTAILSKLNALPTLPAGSWPVAASQMADPFGAYMQIMQQWQKGWADAMASWIKTGGRIGP